MAFPSGGRRRVERRLHAATVAVLFTAVALGSSGCIPEFLKRRPVSERTEEAPRQPAFAGTGLKVSARLLDTREEIEKRFKKFLPDSGVALIEVIARNESGRPLTIHSANGLPLSPTFDGVTLITGSGSYQPLSALDVLAMLIGERRALRYRKQGLFGIVAGVVAVQPFAVFLAHGELSVGRYYRSLVEHSIYPVGEGGVLEPLVLEPGGEVDGFLYFLIPPGENPYIEEGIPEGGAPPWELRFMPAGPAYMDLDSLAICDVRSARSEIASTIAAGRSKDEAPLFALKAATRWRKGGLLVGLLAEIEERGGGALTEVSGFASRSARIADATARGVYAACAVNFRSKSRVYLVRLEGEPALEGTVDFDRNIEGVHLAQAGLLVVTVDGVCRLLSREGLEEIGSGRFGPGIDDLYLDGDRLIVSKEKEISIYGTAGEDLLQLVDRIPVPAAERRVVGSSGDDLFLAHGSKGLGGDTIIVLDLAAFSERSRMALPGHITYAGTSDVIMLQLEEGTLLHIRFVPEDRSFRIEGAGHLPFPAGVIHSENGTFTVLGREGRIVAGDLAPREIAEFTTNVPLNPPRPPAAP